jgi:hypothetical protein
VSDLSEANLRWANLSGADLGAADLSGANLTETNLVRANLAWATLTGAHLICTDFSEAHGQVDYQLATAGSWIDPKLPEYVDREAVFAARSPPPG